MNIITKASLAKLVVNDDNKVEFEKKWGEAFIGKFEQSLVFKVMQGNTSDQDDSNGSNSRVSILFPGFSIGRCLFITTSLLLALLCNI